MHNEKACTSWLKRLLPSSCRWTNSGHACVEFAYVQVWGASLSVVCNTCAAAAAGNHDTRVAVQVDRQGHIVTSLREATASLSAPRSALAFPR